MIFIHRNLKLVIAALLSLMLSLFPRLVWGQDVDVGGALEQAEALPVWATVALLLLAFACGLGIALTVRSPTPSREPF
jgi:hypothetical protein